MLKSILEQCEENGLPITGLFLGTDKSPKLPFWELPVVVSEKVETYSRI